jgi:hypothetical protein
MEKKGVLKLIAGTKKEFRMINKRLENGVSTKNKSGKSFKIEEDLPAMKVSYQKIVDSFPCQPGILLIQGVRKNGSLKTLEFIKSNENIRSLLKKSIKGNRFTILKTLLQENHYEYIEFQLAKAS